MANNIREGDRKGTSLASVGFETDPGVQLLRFLIGDEDTKKLGKQGIEVAKKILPELVGIQTGPNFQEAGEKLGEGKGLLGGLIGAATPQAPTPGPSQEIAEGLIKKEKTEQLKESMQIQGPERTLESAIQLDQQEAQQKQLAGIQAIRTEQGLEASLQQQQKKPEDVAAAMAGFAPQTVGPQGFGERILQKRGFNEQGQFQTGGALANFFEGARRSAGLGSDVDEFAKLQELQGRKPLQKGEREAELIKTQRALLKSISTGKISDVQKQQQLQLSFQNDLGNIVTAFDEINLKGPIGGKVGGLLSATVGKLFGTSQREARQTLESMSNAFVFSAAQYITGQTGRALSDKDFERIVSLSKFGPNMSNADFKGKIQAILNFSNSKIKGSGNTPQFNKADEFINSIRSQSRPRQTTTQSGIKSIRQVN